MTAHEVFDQQNGSVTKAWYEEMNQRGPHGQLCVALFRAQKRSTAAKSYRGGRFRSAAYDVKNWSLSEIVRILSSYPDLDVRWGWKVDPEMEAKGDPHCHVLYIDIPTGQVSFHSEHRLQGPEYHDEWDKAHASTERILAYCDSVSQGEPIREAIYSGPASKAEFHARQGPQLVTSVPRPTARLTRELERGGGRLRL